MQAGENMLLTFTQIQNRVGKSNDIFDQATRATADLSVAMGIDMPRAALQVGKALNDPERGYARLQRIGVAFSDSQIKAIKSMQAAGDTAGAQKVILAELTKEFGGSAKAAGETLPGQLKILQENLRNAGGEVVKFLIPAMSAGLSVMKDVVDWIGRIAHAPSLKVALDIGGEGLKDLGSRIKNQVQSALGGVEWGTVGRQLGQTIGGAIVFTDAALGRALTSLLGWVNAHAQQFADLGLVIALNMASRLFDPAFWADHWSLVVALAAVFLTRGLLKVGGEAGVAFFKGFTVGPFQALGKALSGPFERLPKAVQGLARLAGRVLLAGISEALSALRSLFGKVPGWIKAAFQIGAVVAFWGVLQKVADKVRNVWNWLKRIAGQVWSVVVDVKVNAPSIPGGGALKSIGKGALKGALQFPALGGVIPRVPGSQLGVDSVPAMLTPGEIVVNPQRPQRGLEALRAAGFEGFARGGRAGRTPLRRQHERRAEARERARTELPKWLQLEIATMRQRGDKVGLLRALKKAERWLKLHIGITRSIDNKIALTNELASVQDEIASLEAVGEAPGESIEDVRARLAQTQAQLAAAQSSAQLANAFGATGIFAGAGGGGSAQIVLQSLVTPTPEMLRHAGRAVSEGIGMQGYRRATTARLGY